MGDCGRRKQTETVLARRKKKSLSGVSMPPCLYAYTYARLHTACMLARVHAHLYACTCIERMQTCMRMHQIPRTHDGAQVRSRARRGRLRGVCVCVCVCWLLCQLSVWLCVHLHEFVCPLSARVCVSIASIAAHVHAGRRRRSSAGVSTGATWAHCRQAKHENR